MERKQQACLEKTAGLFMLPARISQSFRGIDDVVFEWIGSSLQLLFPSYMPSPR